MGIKSSVWSIRGSLNWQGEATGLCSKEGGVGNILESSSGRKTVTPRLLFLFVPSILVSSCNPPDLFEPGGVCICS